MSFRFIEDHCEIYPVRRLNSPLARPPARHIPSNVGRAWAFGNGFVVLIPSLGLREDLFKPVDECARLRRR